MADNQHTDPTHNDPRPGLTGLALAWLRGLASLRLTVVLLAAAMALIFVGTLAQTQRSIFAVQKEYFNSLFVIADLGPLRFPCPGGYLIGGALLANLIAAHLAHFKFAWKRCGVFLTHAGVVMLLGGGLATSMLGVDTRMDLTEGATRAYADDIRYPELAVIDTSAAGHDRVVAFPEAPLHQGATLRHPLLPFEIHVDRYYTNSDVVPVTDAPRDWPNPADHEHGLQLAAFGAPATSQSDSFDFPSAYLTLRTLQGAPLGTWLVSMHFFGSEFDRPQQIEVDGKVYLLSLRPRRYYKPFSLTLVKFTHTRYAGTEKDKEFSSRIRLVDFEHHEVRETLVTMNHPLRYRGDTIYQAGFARDDSGSVLEIVHNPAWWAPYVACLVVGAGMLIHFGIRLIAFLRKEAP